MKLNECIKRLKELEKELGNVDVEMYMEDIDGTQLGMDSVTEIDISTDTEGLNPAVYIAHREENN